MSKFKIGTWVRCVRANDHQYIKVGKKYKIRRVFSASVIVDIPITNRYDNDRFKPAHDKLSKHLIL